MFEKRHQKLLPLNKFVPRLIRNILLGLLIISISLAIGMIGYIYFEKISIEDAFMNAAMILSGVGSPTNLETEGGKIFAGIYSLFSGIIFLVVIAVIFAPIFHRFLHKFLINDKK